MSRLLAGVITFFAGIAMVIGIVALVYAMTYLMDRLSCFDSAVLTVQELEERRNASRLTIQSGLAGLLSSERNQIFRAFFEKRSFAYQTTPPEGRTKEQEETKAIDSEATETEDEPDLEEQRGDATTDEDEPSDDIVDVEAATTSMTGEANEESADSTSGEDANAPTCSICLNEYVDGHKVILGPACSHMFHFDCCMQWVDKGNEHCPYCREALIAAKDFHDTAVEVVGEERVAKLRKINEEAARRVAALTSSGIDTISSPVPPVGRHPDSSIPAVVVPIPGTMAVEQHLEDPASEESSPASVEENDTPLTN